MDLWYAIVVYIIIFITIYILARKYDIKNFSAVVLAVLFALIVTLIFFPVSHLQNSNDEEEKKSGGIYSALLLGSIVVILYYLINRILTDVECSGLECSNLQQNVEFI